MKGDVTVTAGLQTFNIDPADFTDSNGVLDTASLPVPLRDPNAPSDWWRGWAVRYYDGDWLEQNWRPSHMDTYPAPYGKEGRDGRECLSIGDHLHQGAYIPGGTSSFRNADEASPIRNDDGFGFDPGYLEDEWCPRALSYLAAQSPAAIRATSMPIRIV